MRVNEINYTTDMTIEECADGWRVSGVTVCHEPDRVHDQTTFTAIVVFNEYGVYAYDRINVDGRGFQGFNAGTRTLEAAARRIACKTGTYCAQGDSFGIVRPPVRPVAD